MEDTGKYLIHADIAADGVVERSDVVGAIFGQTEGLLGDELDLRDLRQSQKVGRIDVEIHSTNGQSHGSLTIATSLDKVETATLAAALETITRIGPCGATLEVREIEDVRTAKRREVVDRAKELLRTGFDDSIMSSDEILAEVREHVRAEDISDFEGLPAGPRVTDSDAIIVVEGRSDVLTLLKYGIKNAIAVEGTNVPDAVAELTNHRTVTAFLDGDRGGDLIFEELAQVGDIDYVTFAPSGNSVEDLDHHELFTALRNKVPYDAVAGLNTPREEVAATDGSTTPAPQTESNGATSQRIDSPVVSGHAGVDAEADTATSAGTGPVPDDESGANSEPDGADTGTGEADGEQRDATTEAEERPLSVYEHATAIIREETDRVRILDVDATPIVEASVADVADIFEDLPTEPSTMILDGILSQQLLDRAADAGLERIVARELGQFTKRPTAVRIHSIDEIAEQPPDGE